MAVHILLMNTCTSSLLILPPCMPSQSCYFFIYVNGFEIAPANKMVFVGERSGHDNLLIRFVATQCDNTWRTENRSFKKVRFKRSFGP